MPSYSAMLHDMICDFVAQPITGTQDLLAFLQHAEQDGSLHNVDVAVAWLRTSGLNQLMPSLQRALARGGRIRFLVGIDRGSSSRQALREVLDLTPDVYVIHDPRPHVTFHPKVFLAQGRERAWLLVGSHNLTGGGTISHLEAGLRLRLDLAQAPDRKVLQQVEDYLRLLRTTPNVSLHLTSEALQQLVDNPRYELLDEDDPASTQRRDEEPDEQGADLPDPIFTSGPWPTSSTSRGAGAQGGDKRPSPDAQVETIAEEPVEDPERTLTLDPLTAPDLRLRQPAPPPRAGLGRDLYQVWDALHAVLLSLGDRVRWNEIDKGYMYRGLARFAMPVGNADNIYLHPRA